MTLSEFTHKHPQDLAREIGFMAAYCVREQVGDVEREGKLEDAAALIRSDREAVIELCADHLGRAGFYPDKEFLDALKAEIGGKL